MSETRRLGSVVVAAVVLAGWALMAAACGADEGNDATPQAPAPREGGERLYVIHCARCHQVDGAGYLTLYPRLADNPLVTLDDPWPVLDAVLEGRGSMPAFRERLTAEEVAQIVSYIRASWGNDAVEVAPQQVR